MKLTDPYKVKTKKEEEIMTKMNMQTLFRIIQHTYSPLFLDVTVEVLGIQPCETVLSHSSVQYKCEYIIYFPSYLNITSNVLCIIPNVT